MFDWKRLLPSIDQDYTGSRFSFYFLILIAQALNFLAAPQHNEAYI